MNKVFCIGLNKTGTTTLMIGFQRLGFKVCDGLNGQWGKASSPEMLKEKALELTEKFDAFEDLPWGLYYGDLYKLYPDAKFIFSYREVDKWWNSFYSHFKDMLIKHHELVYGFDTPLGHENAHKAFYAKHRKEVLDFFADKQECFLALDFSNKQDSEKNWRKFCDFLGHKYKAGEKFPLANTRADRLFWNKLRKIKRKLGF